MSMRAKQQRSWRTSLVACAVVLGLGILASFNILNTSLLFKFRANKVIVNIPASSALIVAVVLFLTRFSSNVLASPLRAASSQAVSAPGTLAHTFSITLSAIRLMTGVSLPVVRRSLIPRCHFTTASGLSS